MQHRLSVPGADRKDAAHINPAAADRAKYILMAKEYGYEIEGYFFRSVIADCVERNRARTGKACVPDKAIVCH